MPGQHFRQRESVLQHGPVNLLLVQKVVLSTPFSNTVLRGLHRVFHHADSVHHHGILESGACGNERPIVQHPVRR